jgi:hypothetical protein
LLEHNQVDELATTSLLQRFKNLDDQKSKNKFQISKAIIDLFDQVAELKGLSGWLEKTPRHLYFCKLISKTAPGAHILHIVRKGEDVVASYKARRTMWKKRGIKLKSVVLAALRWNLDVMLSLKYANVPNNYLITYHSLVENTEAELDRLLRACGLSPDNDLAKRYGKSIQMRSRFTTELTPLQQMAVKSTVLTNLYNRVQMKSNRELSEDPQTRSCT